MYTNSILYELLSTEFIINDYGYITNFYFNYWTNINLYNKANCNSIQKYIFNKIEKIEKIDKKKEKKILFKEVENNLLFKLVWKSKNLLMKNIEDKFEQDDYLKLNNLESSFNSSLINVFYNYSSKIILPKNNISKNNLFK